MADTTINHDQTKPKISTVLLSILLFCAILLVIFVSSVFLYHTVIYKEYTRKQNTSLSLERRHLNLAESKELSQLRWVNRSRGIAKVPIEHAIYLTVRRYK